MARSLRERPRKTFSSHGSFTGRIFLFPSTSRVVVPPPPPPLVPWSLDRRRLDRGGGALRYEGGMRIMVFFQPTFSSSSVSSKSTFSL